MVLAQPLGGTKRMDSALVELIGTTAAYLTDADVSVAFLSSNIGPISRTYTGSGYFLEPKDKHLASVWVAIRGGESAEFVTDLDFELSPGALKMSELDQSFGAYSAAPPAPSGPLYRVQYRYALKDKPYTVAIFATLSAEPAPNSAVKRILLRRDKR
jgi:hypothetical protein